MPNNTQDKELVKIIKEYPDMADWQMELAKIAMFPKAMRPSRFEFMGRYNISEFQYYYWLRHPVVLRVKKILTKRYFHDDIPDILQAMRDEALSGNERAAKLFLEYVDEWKADEDNKPPVQVLNIEQVNVMLNDFRNKKL
jgi:hypothetical protein